MKDSNLPVERKQRKGCLAKAVTGIASYWFIWLPGLLAGLADRDESLAVSLLLVCFGGWILYRLVRWLKDRGIRWGSVGATLAVLLTLYLYGGALMVGQEGWGERWWHYLLPLPVGFLWLLFCLFLERLWSR
ncbi:MAG: hypothetical protein QOF89_4485 [Acidobacteriota bacterium]|jgi:hypothetical protein|nr:hypothetical protein [Acidobacteriota bacterium]